jgi:flavin reductase ActVB
VATDEVSVQAAFRSAMARLAAPVVMVTCRLDGKPWGLTISACCSISVEPPLFMISLSSGTVSAGAISSSGSFGVSILGESLLAAAHHGSRRGAPKFVDHLCDEREDEQPQRTPAIAGALAHLECRVTKEIVAGDHTLYVGRVEGVDLRSNDKPLLYYGRGYRALSQIWPQEQLLAQW